MFRRQQGQGLVGVLLALGMCTAAVLMILLAISMTTIHYDEVGLPSQFGKLTGAVWSEGLHWRPLIGGGVVRVPIQRRSYETSEHPDSSQADYKDYSVPAQTIDGQQIAIKYTVLFRIPSENALEVTRSVGQIKRIVENVVKANSRNLTRTLAQQYSAEELYSGDGILQYQTEAATALAEEFEKVGIVLEDFLVRKVDFDPDYIAAIEQQQIAQEAIETAKYHSEAAKYEAEQQVILAKAEADRNRLLAEAEAYRQVELAKANAEQVMLEADAEAYSIETRGQVLQEYPEIIQLQFIENLDNVNWGIMPADGITPLLPLPTE